MFLRLIKGDQKKGSFQICFAFFAVCSLKITMLTLYIASSLNRSHLSPFWDYFWFYVSCYRGNKMVGLILGFRGSAPCGGVIFPQEINVYHALCIKILFNNTPGKPFWSNIKKTIGFDWLQGDLWKNCICGIFSTMDFRIVIMPYFIQNRIVVC